MTPVTSAIRLRRLTTVNAAEPTAAPSTSVTKRPCRCGSAAERSSLADRPAPADPPAPRLLGPFEPLLLGWTSREEVVPEAGRDIVTDNGIFRPFALVDGRAAATWTRPRGEVVLAPFAPLDAATASALQADARDVERFLGAAGPS